MSGLRQPRTRKASFGSSRSKPCGTTHSRDVRTPRLRQRRMSRHELECLGPRHRPTPSPRNVDRRSHLHPSLERSPDDPINSNVAAAASLLCGITRKDQRKRPPARERGTAVFPIAPSRSFYGINVSPDVNAPTCIRAARASSGMAGSSQGAQLPGR